MKTLEDFRQAMNKSGTGYNGHQDHLAVNSYLDYLRERVKGLEDCIRQLNHCPICRRYITWPPGQWEGYQTDESLCHCKPEAGS